MPDGNPNWSEYPVTVVLCFRNKIEKDKFFGGLSDGFGENFCNLDWPWQKANRGPDGSTIGFDEQQRFAVTVFGNTSPTETKS